MNEQEQITNLILRRAQCVKIIATLHRLRFELSAIGMTGAHEYHRLMDAVIERVAEIHNGEL